jgi:hypothetical protein
MNANFHAFCLYKNFFLRAGPVLLLLFGEGAIGPANARPLIAWTTMAICAYLLPPWDPVMRSRR